MIKIGTQLTVERKVNDSIETYKCRVVHRDEQAIYIDYPIDIHTNKTAFLLNGVSLKIIYIDDKKQSYQFQTIVTGRKKINIPLIALKVPDKKEIKRIQRRQYVRVETAIDVSIHSEYSFVTVTEDISQGGCSIILPEGHQHTIGMKGTIYLVLPLKKSNHYHMLSFETVRVWQKQHKKIASLQFINPSEVDRTNIFRLCLQRQVDERKKQNISK